MLKSGLYYEFLSHSYGIYSIISSNSFQRKNVVGRCGKNWDEAGLVVGRSSGAIKTKKDKKTTIETFLYSCLFKDSLWVMTSSRYLKGILIFS